ncbi:MAG: isoprenylcysteine carboxylmethyltransferase family protein [Candidatus Acidiferrales bacterium]
MKATSFEFRYRSWIIALLYTLGFWAYSIDHVNSVQYVIRETFGPHYPRESLLLHLAFAFAALLVGLGALIRTWGAAYLRSNIVHDANLHSDTLVADGPYRFVRHPLYFGSILATIGVALMASRLGAVFMVVTLSLLFIRLAGREEVELEQQQGESYLAFRRRVPRILPALTPRLPAGQAKPQWGQAFLGEGFMWGFTLAVATFAITLSPAISGIIWGVALLAFWQQQYVHNRRRRAAPVA